MSHMLLVATISPRQFDDVSSADNVEGLVQCHGQLYEGCKKIVQTGLYFAYCMIKEYTFSEKSCKFCININSFRQLIVFQEQDM